jgi:hypothetical protein
MQVIKSYACQNNIHYYYGNKRRFMRLPYPASSVIRPDDSDSAFLSPPSLRFCSKVAVLIKKTAVAGGSNIDLGMRG